MGVNYPKWLETAIFYEVYPQSFKDSNGDGIGDIEGIIEKIDYIEALGCNAIWMNPCFESPFGDAGYDVSDYYKVAPRYGTNGDLKRLFDVCHKRGMHILLDLVAGHTSVEHEWFKKSSKGTPNEFTDRYVWTNSVWIQPQGMGCIRGMFERDGSCAVNFFSNQPALNYGFANCDENWQQTVDDEGPRSTLAELMKIMEFWLGLGCDGFRVDMAGSLVKNDPDQTETIKLWQKVRAFLDEKYPNAVMISEWGEPEKAIKAGFNMDFLLHFGPSHYNKLFRGERPYFGGNGDVSPFVTKFKELSKQVGDKGLICIPSGNHDMERLAKNIGGARLKLAFAFLLSMSGAPFIYYGDEIGMKFVENLLSVEGGYYRTGSRTPMQWDKTLNAGFSTAPKEKLYIRQDESENRPTVEEQIKDLNSLLNEVKKLIKIRKENKALQNCGKIEFINEGYPLIYERDHDGQKIRVIINPSDKEFEVERTDGRIIYQLGADYMSEGNKTTVSPCSAAFIER